jgi:hypothetical protein
MNAFSVTNVWQRQFQEISYNNDRKCLSNACSHLQQTNSTTCSALFYIHGRQLAAAAFTMEWKVSANAPESLRAARPRFGRWAAQRYLNGTSQEAMT